MRRMMILGVLVAGLAACGGAEEPEAAAETEPVVAEAKPAADPAPAAPDPAETAREEAEAFLRALYGRMENDAFAPLAEGADRTVFTAEVVRMLDRARTWTDEGMHPALEADPVCLCQHPYGLTLRDVTVTEATGDRAAVRVRFDFGKQDDAESPRAPLVILRREADVWRVDDIRTDDGFSFRRTLAE